MIDEPAFEDGWPDVRTGMGVDVHAFSGPGPVILGGVRIAHDRGLAGHSDADCLLHAAADALLGATALGDIGMHFPDTDPALAGAESSALLGRVVEMVAAQGWAILNVDTTVVAQEPRISGHREDMRGNLARICGVGVDRVSVKATTTERLGFLGRTEGIAALAIATVARLTTGGAPPSPG